MWPECSAAYHRYINNLVQKSSTSSSFTSMIDKLKVEIVTPPIEIIPNIPTESHKRLTLKRLYEEEEEEITIYKIGDNYIKKLHEKMVMNIL